MNLWILYYKINYIYLVKRQLNSSRKRAFFCNVFNRDFNSNGIKYIYVLIKPWPGLNMTSEFSLSWLCNLLMIIASIWFRFLCVTRYYSKLSIKKENQRWHFQIFHTFIFSPKYFSTFQRLKLSIHRAQKNHAAFKFREWWNVMMAISDYTRHLNSFKHNVMTEWDSLISFPVEIIPLN